MTSELPDMEFIFCTRVTWTSALSTVIPHRRPNTKRNNLFQWNLDDCTPLSPAHALSLLLHSLPRSQSWADEDLPGVIALLESLQPARSLLMSFFGAQIRESGIRLGERLSSMRRQTTSIPKLTFYDLRFFYAFPVT